MTPTLGPGTRLANRYRLDVLLSDVGGARFWRATDTVLARSVGVHLIASDDPRATALIDAAQQAATVADPRILRVLDCAEDGRGAWTVTEWGAGRSLDLLLEQGLLAPMRAAWVAREIAEALVTAHAAGRAHGTLRPERILISDSGAVMVRGFMTDTALAGTVPVDPHIDPIEDDVVNLASILYTSVCGRWPGTAASAIPAAPFDVHGPLRPRQVRAGVPRLIDGLCQRVLRTEAHDHTRPIATSLEVRAALTDYLRHPDAVSPSRLSDLYVDPGRREQGPSPFTATQPRVGLGRISDGDPADTQPAPPPRWDEEPGLEPYADSPDRPLFAPTLRHAPSNSTAARGSDEWLYGERPPPPPSRLRLPGRHRSRP